MGLRDGRAIDANSESINCPGATTSSRPATNKEQEEDGAGATAAAAVLRRRRRILGTVYGGDKALFIASLNKQTLSLLAHAALTLQS